MNNKIKNEYLGIWSQPDLLYDQAFWLWVKYYFETEWYDRQICSGVSPYTGEAMPMDAYERKFIDRNEKYWMEQISQIKRQYGIDNETWNTAKNEVSRFTYEYLCDLMGLENNPHKSR